MGVLLDTHILLALLGAEASGPEEWSTERLFVSVASLWEIAIKIRQGKLELGVLLLDLEQKLEELGWTVLPITASHAVAEVSTWPPTKDPFDRLLLAVCEVDELRLVTRDRKLASHPLAWRPASA